MVMHEVKPGWTITKEWEGYTIEAENPVQEVQYKRLTTQNTRKR